MNRRDFLIWGSLAGVTALRWRGPVLRMTLLTPVGATPTPNELGIRMGIEEAERAALLFGGEVHVTTITGDARLSTTSASLTRVMQRDHASAILGGVASEECAVLADLAEHQGFLYFNTASSEDALRGANCRATAFHVMPSAAMYRDALARAEPPVASGARSVAWDASLVRFGADTLNQRFQTRCGKPMTDEAWAGWLGVKILWESALRARSADPVALGTALTQDAARFDGHKGRALSFRPWDHQLRQPVYVLTGASGAAHAIEVPIGASADAPSATILDELGVSSARTSCHWARQ